MSDTYEYNSEGQGYLPGPSFGGGTGSPGGGSGYPGYAGYPPPPPPPARNHKRPLIITAAVALLAGAAAGGLIGGLKGSPASTATATSKTSLTASQIATRVDPGLVDVIATDGDEGATSYGTGIVLTATGEVLTNNHVIEGATSVKVIDIGNNRTYTAKVVGYDASHDVAVIQLQNASGLTTASLGDSSSVTTGDSVVALGNAEGKDGTPSVATGTVQGLNQSITASDELSGVDEQLTGLIETNAPIEPGDSGGPLVNAYGQVVGMDTAASTNYQFQGQSQSNGAATNAYSIPINEAVSIASQIESGTGSSTVHTGQTAFIGIEVSDQSSTGTGTGYGNGSGNEVSGAELEGVLQGSPAAEAGLAQGDTITSLGGQTVSSSEDIQQILVKYHPGDSIQIVWADQEGQSHTATLTLANGPAA